MTPTETLETPTRWPSLVGWGAIIAGLFFVITVSWLLFLLGSAIGISVADASDMEAIGEGFGISAAVWIVVSGIIAYFLGSIVASRLSGRADDTDGALHGLILWSVATVVTLVLGFWGVGGLVNAGKSLISGTVSAGTAIVQSAGSAGSAVTDLARSPVMTDVQAIIKRAAAGAISQTPGSTLSQEEAQRAIAQLDQGVVQTVARELVQGNTDAAKDELARGTGLPPQEVDRIITNLSQQVQGSPAAQQIEQRVREEANQALTQLSAATGGQVAPDRLRQAMERLNPDVLSQVAQQLILGNTEGAKNVLIANTNLTEQEVNALISGVSQQVSQRVEQAKQEVAQTAEQVAHYTQALMWTLFFSALLALAASVAGGLLGARTLHRWRGAFVGHRRERLV